MDRIDMFLEVPKVKTEEFQNRKKDEGAENSATIKIRVE